MNAEPISKELFDKLIAAGVNEVTLRFSGGSDEGYLDVDLGDIDHFDEAGRKLINEVENWAWDVYSYSGAGEGNDYGDDIEYDLVNNRVSSQEWYTARTDGDSDEIDLVLDDNKED